jgi:hypothetical protein
VLLQVEFAPPVGYKEPERVKKPDEEMVVDPAELMPEPTGFVAFRGEGNRCVALFWFSKLFIKGFWKLFYMIF